MVGRTCRPFFSGPTSFFNFKSAMMFLIIIDLVGVSGGSEVNVISICGCATQVWTWFSAVLVCQKISQRLRGGLNNM